MNAKESREETKALLAWHDKWLRLLEAHPHRRLLQLRESYHIPDSREDAIFGLLAAAIQAMDCLFMLRASTSGSGQRCGLDSALRVLGDAIRNMEVQL